MQDFYLQWSILQCGYFYLSKGSEYFFRHCSIYNKWKIDFV